MIRRLATRDGRALEVAEYGDPGGHPILFFHGFIGSHHQASYIADRARREGLRIIAPNRPGVGRSEFVVRASALETVADVEDIAEALGLGEFSLIGLSGGTPYALAALYRLGRRVRTTTLISGMGPIGLPGALRGMDPPRRLFLRVYSRHRRLARPLFRRLAARFRGQPGRFLDRLIRTWSPPDQEVFRDRRVYDLFLRDLEQVFVEGNAPESLAQEMILYRHYGFPLHALPRDRRVCLWQGLDDSIVPPAMAWALVRNLPNREAHFLPGAHFMAVDLAGQIIARLKESLETRDTDATVRSVPL